MNSREEKPQRETPNPLEPSNGHLPETPSHICLEKVKDFVNGLTWQRGVTTIKKYSYENR